MKEMFLDKSIKFINQYQEYDSLKLAKLRYGLEGIYLTVTKTIILILIALTLHIFSEFLLTLFLFNIIRYTGFGFHAEKSYQCLLMSIFNFIIIPITLIYVTLPNYIIFGICIICLFHYILFAPADTQKRPLTNKRKRLIRKVLTVTIGILYTLLIFFYHNPFWTGVLLSALIIQMIVISPLTYKLFKQPYNNYKQA